MVNLGYSVLFIDSSEEDEPSSEEVASILQASHALVAHQIVIGESQEGKESMKPMKPMKPMERIGNLSY